MTPKALVARDLMTPDVVTVSAETPIRDYVGLIRLKGFSGLPVVDGDGKVVGMVSHSDVLRGLVAFLASGAPAPGDHTTRRRVGSRLVDHLAAIEGTSVRMSEYLALPVRAVMSEEVTSCAADSPLAAVCEAMAHKRVHRIVVVDDKDRPIGIVSAMDVVGRIGKSG